MSCFYFFFSSRRRHTRWNCDWSSDVCSSDLQRVRSAENASVQAVVAPRLRLSMRELEVLRWLRRGKSAWEVAQILGRSEHTVKNQMRSLYGKLGAANRAQALFPASKLAIPD